MQPYKQLPVPAHVPSHNSTTSPEYSQYDLILATPVAARYTAAYSTDNLVLVVLVESVLGVYKHNSSLYEEFHTSPRHSTSPDLVSISGDDSIAGIIDFDYIRNHRGQIILYKFNRDFSTHQVQYNKHMLG